MAAYQYTALDRQGKQRKGLIEADSIRQARQKLRDQQLLPSSVIAVSAKSPARFQIFKNRRAIKVNDLALLTRQLATLISAGLPIEQTLLTVAEQTERNNVKGILMAVRAKVLEGHSLATGLGDFPAAFPPLYRATVAAGEQSGHLPQILEQLADYIEKQNRIRQKIRQALLYPGLMTTISIMIVIFLLIFVVPKIAGVFSDSQQSLPTLTVVLLSISSGIKNYGWYILLVLIGVGFLWRKAMQRPEIRYKFHLLILKVPVIGNAFKEINSARFLRTFGILFAATVPVLEAMQTACELITLLPMRAAVEQAIVKVREGGSISLALKQTHYFSPMSIHLIASGESSGALENMLERTADNQDRDITMLIESSLTLFEPLMIIVMGAIVLFIVLAVLLPIFQLDVIVGQ